MNNTLRPAAAALALSLVAASPSASAQSATDAGPASASASANAESDGGAAGDASLAVLPEAHTTFVASDTAGSPTLTVTATEQRGDEVTRELPVDRVVEVEPADRAAINAACRDAMAGTDYLMWTGTIALVLGGVAASYAAYSTPDPSHRTVEQRFLAGLGPGMIVGAIGYPFPRGILRDGDALWQTCQHLHDHVHHSAHNVDLDYEYADRVLRDRGGPTSALLIWLLAAATSWVATGLTLAVAAAQTTPAGAEYVQLIGGIVPGLFVGWLLVPATPAGTVARRYRLGGYRTHRASAITAAPTLTFRPIDPGGVGMGISVTF